MKSFWMNERKGKEKKIIEKSETEDLCLKKKKTYYFLVLTTISL